MKSAALFTLGLALFAVVGRDLGEIARRVAEALNLDVHRDHVWRAIERLSRLDVRHVSWSAGGAIAYGCVLAIEAVGLARRRAWAAWLAVGVGALFLPYEIYEMVAHPRLRIAAALAVNLAVVVYLTIEALRANRAYAEGYAGVAVAIQPPATTSSPS